MEQKSILYLVATPIGNLEDITLRALRVLKEADIIAAEDTRHTLKLLNHYNIKTPITSYHEHNKKEKGISLIKMLEEGRSIALVSDAGTPCISDPGFLLVKMAAEKNIEITAIPGASAAVAALILSGLSTERFIFEGFLPTKGKKREERIENIKSQSATIIIYEAPHRLKELIKDLHKALGDRKVAITKELTKHYETIERVSLSEAVELYKDKQPMGEYVLIIEGLDTRACEIEKRMIFENMTVKEHMEIYLMQGFEIKDAMKKAASDRGISKSEIYREYVKNN